MFGKYFSKGLAYEVRTLSIAGAVPGGYVLCGRKAQQYYMAKKSIKPMTLDSTLKARNLVIVPLTMRVYVPCRRKRDTPMDDGEK